MVFEPGLAFLRYIRWREYEVLRGIYVAVRDRNWGTVEPRVHGLRVDDGGESFRIQFEVECRQDPIDYFWNGLIEGTAAGTVVYRMEGHARTSFLRNRIGFCVLHPIAECAGQPCTVEKVDGSVEHGVFPEFISPHQPFRNIRAITHTVQPGVTAEVRFAGDVFEMEDQRNWTDASYKTYCTPLELPFPVRVKAGERVEQTITLRLRGEPAHFASTVPDTELVVKADSAAVGRKLPKVGLGYAAESPPPTPREIERLRALRPAHIRVDLRLSRDDHGALLQKAVQQARELNAAIEGAVFVTDEADRQLGAFSRLVEDLQPEVSHWLVFHESELSTSDRWVRLARRHLKGAVGGGTNANFAELNRGRPRQPGDVVCYSANPQVHASDNDSLIETLAGLRDTVRSARQFSGQARLAVTPITLRQKFNPVATSAEQAPRPGELPPTVDPRQATLFGSAWTLGNLQALTEAGADSLTYYETTGWRGVMELERGSPLPEKFPSIPGGVFPLYHVFADLAEFAGGRVIPLRTSRPGILACLVLQKQKQHCVLLANLSDRVRNALVLDWGLGDAVRLRMLDEQKLEWAVTDPESFRRERGPEIENPSSGLKVALPSYSYVRIDPA